MNYPASISSKLPQVSTSIFSVMSKMANDYGAINLSQGFPDFPISAELIALVQKYMNMGLNQYAPMQGVLSLRGAITEKVKFLYDCEYNPESEVTITAGATQALFTAIMALVKEGDEVIVFTPAYDSYAPAIELAGGKTVFIPLKGPEYKMDWDYVKKMINSRTKMIMINTPHNPTGTILEEADMLELEKITKDNDIIILSDEVYEHIIFDGQKHQSVSKFPGLAHKSLVVGSFGKTFHATGWKMGYCIGPEKLMREFRKIHQFTVFSVNTPIQYAIAEYLQNKDNYLHIGQMYQAKRDRFLNAIQSSRFKPVPCSGTYFQLLNYSAISKESDVKFAEILTKEHTIASIPVSVFYNNPIDDKVLRFCFAKSDETIDKAAEILNSI
jgi:methionine aminotransferase